MKRQCIVRVVCGAVLLTALFCARLLAQGDLVPPGPPAATQKSLQEIWDKLDGVEQNGQSIWFKVDLLQQQVAGLVSTLNAIQAENARLSAMLLSLGTASGAFPWSVAVVGEPTFGGGNPSLAFTPEGNTAVSHYDVLTGSLAFSLRDGATWQTETVDNSATLVGKYGEARALRPAESGAFTVTLAPATSRTGAKSPNSTGSPAGPAG